MREDFFGRRTFGRPGSVRIFCFHAFFQNRIGKGDLLGQRQVKLAGSRQGIRMKLQHQLSVTFFYLVFGNPRRDSKDPVGFSFCHKAISVFLSIIISLRQWLPFPQVFRGRLADGRLRKPLMEKDLIFCAPESRSYGLRSMCADLV